MFNNSIYLKGIFLIVLLVILMVNASNATTYYSRVAIGNFATAASWSTSPTGTPTNGAALTTADVFIIQNGHNITVAANITVAGITINTGGTLTSGAGIVLTVNGSWVNDGTFTPSTGTVTFGTATVSISGSSTLALNDLSITAATTLTLNNNVNVAGNVTMIAPSTTTAGITISGTNSLNVTGTMSLPVPTNNNRNITVNVGAGTLTVGGMFTMSATTSGNRLNFLNISTGTVNLNGGITTGTTASRIVFSDSGILNISGNVSTGPPALTPSTGTVKFSGGAQTVWVETYYNLTLDGTGSKTMSATRIVDGIFTLQGTATASAAPTYGANATLRYNTAISRTVGAEWLATFAATGGVIIDNTGAIITNGNKVFNVDIPLTINTGATLSPAAGNTFSFGGDLINNGTWTASTGAVTITLGRTSQSIGSFSTSGLVTMSKASGTATFTGNIDGGAFTMNGAGTLNLGAGLTHTFSGDWTNTAGTLEGNTSTLNIGGNVSGTGITFTAGTSTVNFNGSGAQNIPELTFYNLNTSTGNTKSLQGTTTVSNVLTINGSTTLDLGSFTLTLSGSGTPLVNSGTFTSGTSTVNFSNAASTNVPALNYYNLDLTGGTRVLANSGTIGIAAVFTPGAGGFTVTGSTVEFNGGAQTIPAFTFNDLVLSGSGAKTIPTTITVSVNIINIQNGPTLDIVGTALLNITKP